VRLTLYRRIINAVGLDELDALEREMSDRFGKIPGEVKYLVALSAVRNFGGRYGIHEAEIRKGLVRVKYSGNDIPPRVKTYIKSLGRNVKYVIDTVK